MHAKVIAAAAAWLPLCSGFPSMAPMAQLDPETNPASCLYTLTAVRVRDFHFVYSTLLLDLFSFPREQRFVSVSEDGLSVPQIYLHDDVNHAQHGYTPSPVSTIDGVPALEYLQKAAVMNGWSHDPDARFNGLFPSVANNANPSYGHPEPSFPDLPDTMTVKCQNGTVFEFANTAFVRANFTSITSGADLYNAYGPGNGTGPQVFPWSFYLAAERDWTSLTLFEGYPEPVNATKTRSVAGSLPHGPEFTDVAVLSATAAAIYFENIATLLFALFPGTNFPIHWQTRAHPQYAWLDAQLWNDTNPSAPWPMTNQIKPDNHPWTSFTDFYGPHKGLHGAYTSPSIYNLTDYTTSFLPPTSPSPNSTNPPPSPSPYLIPWTTPPFPPENIIILTDGQCGSACALTTTMLTHTHAIRTLALGGRPLHAPMQTLGQTKGGPVQGFVNFPTTDVDRTTVPPGVSIPPPPRGGYNPPLRVSGVDALGWGGLTTFNVANTLLPGEDEGEVVPMQFRYEAANCRLFFTWEMAKDVEAVWRRVAEAAWRGGRCVPGSTTEADGRIGGVPPGYREGVEDRYRVGEGPGAVGR
ncbi:hypothetical protein C8A01DRAFT_51188 [Parachaetomium inaequale]|uniref:CPAF-like PDZ domain-containing protein n=1 Tax=Parachaetomium inaequale TaxID=2588326 RepID=A0AAN6P6S8_9PEZI|nr:hypothetical protein C8A01DRAFT_51188 [Parachaetomium inaequale]